MHMLGGGDQLSDERAQIDLVAKVYRILDV
jgi:hypothetical protein